MSTEITISLDRHGEDLCIVWTLKDGEWEAIRTSPGEPTRLPDLCSVILPGVLALIEQLYMDNMNRVFLFPK